MREILDINNNWYYKNSFAEEDILNSELSSYKEVQIPHTNVEVPYNYFDDKIYQFVSCYKKQIDIPLSYDENRIFIDFEGVMTYCKVYVNGKYAGEHKGGYTPFAIELTKLVDYGKSNFITVMVDSTEREDIPPFGGTIDYLTFGGIYREVSLRIVESNFIKDVFIKCNNPMESIKSLDMDIELSEIPEDNYSVEVAVFKDNNKIISKCFACDNKLTKLTLPNIENIELWDIENPNLYDIRFRLFSNTNEIDEMSVRFGFRKAEFKDTGFYLNDKLIKLLGLNRHQSFPYVGYAMPKRAQAKDADILKEYGLNMVRTSHYPQSVHFINRCDEIGLLVFEEIPGWQHIGDEVWQEQVLEDLKAMIIRDRNKASVVLWGVRINESGDHHVLYSKTNELARELDPTRQTGGVRFLTKSEFLEDVYTMNDFIHDGGGKEYLKKNVKNFSTYDDTPEINSAKTALRTQDQVTGQNKIIPYLVTEYGGHMYPTKKSDSEEKLNEHALIHARVLDAMYGDQNISGAIGWCAFDYNTHRDFGSGDKICYHGVMDMFRLPKYAANVYKSQKSPEIEAVLEPATLWARGERAISGVMPLNIFTNCDYIKFYYGDSLFGTFYPNTEKFPNLPHAPVIIDQAIGFWGSAWEEAHFEGYVNDKKVIEKKYSANAYPKKLLIDFDDVVLSSGDYDVTRCTVKIVDIYNNPLMFSKETIKVEISGFGEIIGSNNLSFDGGTAVFWIKTTGEKGLIKVNVVSTLFGEYQSTIIVE